MHTIELTHESLSHETSRNIQNQNQRRSLEANALKTSPAAVQNVNFDSRATPMR